MAVKIRCTECGRTVRAAPSAKSAQKVCGKACRKTRNRKLARKRRRANLQECRQDEVDRKRKQRELERDRRALTTEPESTSRETPSPRHAPVSTSNFAKHLSKVDKIVGEVFEMSRARLRQELEAMLSKSAAQPPMPPARAGP